MAAVLADAERVALFTELARGREWLRWAERQPVFKQLFDPTETNGDGTGSLAVWFAEHYVMEEALTGVALGVMQSAGGRLSFAAWSAICQQLHILGGARPGWLTPWIPMLIASDLHGGRDWLEYMLAACRWPDDRETALLLFDHLSEPHIVMQPSFGESMNPRLVLKLRGGTYWLEQAWQELFLPHLQEAVSDLLPIIDRHLRRAHLLLRCAGAAHDGWDPVAFARSAVEPSQQDRYKDDADILVDAARDCIEVLLRQRDRAAPAYLDMWADSSAAILRRLAVHGWIERADVDATTKLTWLRDRGWLGDIQLHHEVFRLLAHALPGADAGVCDELVADVVASPASGDSEAYQLFNVLAWIDQHRPGLDRARAALQHLQDEHPDFAPRPHPDLLSWIEVGFATPQPPMSTDELLHKLAADAAGAVGELRRFETAERPFQGPGWDDALAVLKAAVKQEPEQGFAVIEAAGEQPDLVRAVIDGWSTARTDEPLAERILATLASLNLSDFMDGISRLLADGGQDDGHPTTWHAFDAARQLASAVWGTLPDLEQSASAGIGDWLTHAINTTAGRLTLFWLHAAQADWRAAGEAWTGLPQGIRPDLEALLDRAGDSTACAEVVLASQVHFLFQADREWCRGHVLPLLGWQNTEQALRTWQGYLIWGRWNDQLLDDGLWAAYLGVPDHLQDFPDEARRRLHHHIAAIAISGSPDTLRRVREFTSAVSRAHLDDAAAWLEQVGWMLRRATPDTAEQLWQTWMHPYWTGRLASIPVDLTEAEASAMARWLPYLTGSVEEGVALATARPAGMGEHADILREIDDDRLRRAPTPFATLVSHLLQGTGQPFYGCSELERIVKTLRPLTREAMITSIIKAAVRLRCTGSAVW